MFCRFTVEVRCRWLTWHFVPCLGSGEQDTEGWVVSSESCSFQSIGAKSVTASICFMIRGCVWDVDHFCPSLLSDTTERCYQERLSSCLSTESSPWVLSLALREMSLLSVYLNMFTLPGQTLFLKVWLSLSTLVGVSYPCERSNV